MQTFHFERKGIMIPTLENSWRCRYTANADLIQMGDQYIMYYRGTDFSHDRIGAMVCPVNDFDGIHFKQVSENYILDVGAPGAFDDGYILDPSAVVVNGKVYLYYSALDSRGIPTLGLAVSEDGFHFEKYPEPLMGGRCPEIVWADGLFWMYYMEEAPRGGYDIYCTQSSDGIHFGESIQVLSTGPVGSWEALSVSTPRIFYDRGTYYMVYSASDRFLDDPCHFGLATSEDLIHWKKYDANPIFSTSADPAAWDCTSIWYGTTEYLNGKYWMWYEACNQFRSHDIPDFLSVVGLAVLDAPYFFVKPRDYRE